MFIAASIRRFSLSALVLGAVAASAHACAVCFGGASSDLSRGFFWGVIVLLALPFLLMGGLVSLIVRATRKTRDSRELS